MVENKNKLLSIECLIASLEASSSQLMSILRYTYCYHNQVVLSTHTISHGPLPNTKWSPRFTIKDQAIIGLKYELADVING
jgi:hypothetical protein